MNSLNHISHKGKGKGPRAKREKGKPAASVLRCISTLHSPRARTHDTKGFPGYRGACLKANSLPPTSDIYIYIYIEREREREIPIRPTKVG